MWSPALILPYGTIGGEYSTWLNQTEEVTTVAGHSIYLLKGKPSIKLTGYN
jgi:hypothetical protein